MKINLTKNDVMDILCHHFDLAHTTERSLKRGDTTEPDFDEIYWEGNLEPLKVGEIR